LGTVGVSDLLHIGVRLRGISAVEGDLAGRRPRRLSALSRHAGGGAPDTYALGVADYFLVETARGPAWDDAKARREQTGWEAHATFMDRLVDAGFIVLGGPVGELGGDQALLVVKASDEDEARTRLAADPWADGVLSIRSIRPWTIWLRCDGVRLG
jgi:uncharacterized protein YciI